MRAEENTHAPVGEGPIGETIVWMNNADVKLGKYVWKLR